jgi:hypothetical protein
VSEERELPCQNQRCGYWDFEAVLNCDGESGGEAAIATCKNYAVDMLPLHLQQRCDLRETCSFLKEARDALVAMTGQRDQWQHGYTLAKEADARREEMLLLQISGLQSERDLAIAKSVEWKPVLAEWSKRVAELTAQLAAAEKGRVEAFRGWSEDDLAMKEELHLAEKERHFAIKRAAQFRTLLSQLAHWARHIVTDEESLPRNWDKIQSALQGEDAK